jgi:hypothetical protein
MFWSAKYKLAKSPMPLPFEASSLNPSGVKLLVRQRPVVLFNQGKRAYAKGLSLTISLAKIMPEVKFIISAPIEELERVDETSPYYSENIYYLAREKKIEELIEVVNHCDAALVLGKTITQSASACLAWSCGCPVITNLKLDAATPQSMTQHINFDNSLLDIRVSDLSSDPHLKYSLAKVANNLMAALSLIRNSNHSREAAANAYRECVARGITDLL